jgi:tripartite-type tricarboxylate transporter receptor subunit TctC
MAASKRSKALPDVATFSQLKIDGLDFSPWYGVSTSKGVPKEIVNHLNATMAKALRRPDVLARFEQLVIEPLDQTPEQFDEFIRAEVVRLKPIVEASGARGD